MLLVEAIGVAILVVICLVIAIFAVYKIVRMIADKRDAVDNIGNNPKINTLDWYKGLRMGDHKWIYGYFFRRFVDNPEDGNHYKEYILDHFGHELEIVPGSCRQYTGMHDQEGMPIYDGDVLYSPSSGNTIRYKARILPTLEPEDNSQSTRQIAEKFYGELLSSLVIKH